MLNSRRVVNVLALTGVLALIPVTAAHAQQYEWGWRPPLPTPWGYCGSVICPGYYVYVGPSYFSGSPTYIPTFVYPRPVYRHHRHVRRYVARTRRAAPPAEEPSAEPAPSAAPAPSATPAPSSTPASSATPAPSATPPAPSGTQAPPSQR